MDTDPEKMEGKLPENNEEELLSEPTTTDLKEEIAEVIAQRDEYLAGWQRSKADFINHKKEEMKKLEDIARYGSEGLIKELLSILHTFDLALKAMDKDADKGLLLIRSQMEDVLKKRGVEKIELNPGDPFDPATAEAMMEVDSESPPGSIVEVLEPGYRMYDKVLRAAKVSISKDK
jgi:molecular chaperone GrpE